jgi:hypothetical protein
LPYEVYDYPDSDNWPLRAGKVGKFAEIDYWFDEPNPPIIKSPSEQFRENLALK